MKVLVSAYACDPYRGSEPGVGWAAVCRLAEVHKVYVITDVRNRSGWERAREAGEIPDSVKGVRYLKKPPRLSENRFVAHLQSWWSYRSFNRLVYNEALAWHREVGFDLCHQVTIAAWRMPSPLCRLPIPFIWGPIGGAGFIPPAFRGMLSISARQFERVRDWQTAMTLRSGAFRECIRKTAVVFAANQETELLLKPHRGGRPMFRLPIASVSREKFERFRLQRSPSADGPLRLFAGGNMEGRKGVSLALKALARVAEQGVDFHYTVAGGGPEVPALKALSDRLGLNELVTFHPGFGGDDYIRQLQETDVYFLPSFRESTPVTLLEAYLAGCYPVVADTSAQGEIVRLAGGHAVPADSMDGLIDGLAEAVGWCARHRTKLPALARQGSDKVAEHFGSERYDRVVREAYAIACGSVDAG